MVKVDQTPLSDHGIVSTQLLPDEPNSIGADNQTQAVNFQIYVDRLIERRTRVIAILAAVALATGFSFYNKTTPNLLVPPPNSTQERQVK